MGHYYETVVVLKGGHLIDCESFQRRYSRADGRELAPGAYVVSWPDNTGFAEYDASASFIGPYRLQRQAELAMQYLVRSEHEAARPASPQPFGSMHAS